SGGDVALKKKDLDKPDDLHTISVSNDQPVRGTSLDGTEAPNYSSGGLLARTNWAATGAGIGVAVIDSGIAVHPDLLNVVKTVDFTGGLNVRMDPFGHGTHVAGIIGGSGASSGGQYAGIAPGVRLINLRVLDGQGGGSTSAVIA